MLYTKLLLPKIIRKHPRQFKIDSHDNAFKFLLSKPNHPSVILNDLTNLAIMP